MKIKVVQTPRIKIVNPAPPPAELTVYPVGPRGEPGPGVPAGGTAGQVLKKIDGTDYNTAWQNEAGASPVVGLSQVAFGDPSTGALTTSPYFVFAPTLSGVYSRFSIGEVGTRSGQVYIHGALGGYSILEADYLTTSSTFNLRPGFVSAFQFASTSHIYGDSTLPYIQLKDGAGAYIGYNISGNSHAWFGNNIARITSGRVQLASGAVATDMSVRVDPAGAKVGPFSSIGSDNLYPFEVLWTNGSPMFQVTHTASETNIYENNPLTGVGFRKNIFNQTAGLYYSGGFNIGNTLQIGQQNSLATISLVQDFSGGYVADINYAARYHTFTGKIFINTSSDSEIEFAGAHVANILYGVPSRDMTIGVHSGGIYFTANNYSTYSLSILPSNVYVNAALSVLSLAGTGNRRVHVNAAGDLVATEPAFDVVNEVPSGLINGSNATFTTAGNFVPGTEEVYLNGLKLVKLEDYNTTGTNQIDLYVSPGAGEHLIVNYKKI